MTRHARLASLAVAILALALTASAQMPEAGPDGVVREARAVERLLAEASPTRVQVQIASSRLIRPPAEQELPVTAPTRRLVFHVPAAAVLAVNTREGPEGNQSIVFELWNPSLDPVRPERVADHEELCRDNRPLHCAAPECGRQARRIANGERSLLFDLSNYTSTPERRQYVLGSLAGHDTRRRWNGPCEVHEDPALGMLVGQAPEGQRAQACGVFWSPAPHWDTSGRLPRQATFLKREADGSARFVVTCRDWVEDAARPSTTNCQLLAFFGEWPLLMWVPNNRSADWEATYERVVGFLARHLVVQN